MNAFDPDEARDIDEPRDMVSGELFEELRAQLSKLLRNPANIKRVKTQVKRLYPENRTDWFRDYEDVAEGLIDLVCFGLMYSPRDATDDGDEKAAARKASKALTDGRSSLKQGGLTDDELAEVDKIIEQARHRRARRGPGQPETYAQRVVGRHAADLLVAAGMRPAIAAKYAWEAHLLPGTAKALAALVESELADVNRQRRLIAQRLKQISDPSFSLQRVESVSTTEFDAAADAELLNISSASGVAPVQWTV